MFSHMKVCLALVKHLKSSHRRNPRYSIGNCRKFAFATCQSVMTTCSLMSGWLFWFVQRGEENAFACHDHWLSLSISALVLNNPLLSLSRSTLA